MQNGIAVPNVFSPNGDGINELFGVSFGSDLQVVAMKGSIFDRWGNLVYGSDAIPFIWNGLSNDERVMVGVYAYVILVDYTLGGNTRQEVLYGGVTVVR